MQNRTLILASLAGLSALLSLPGPSYPAETMPSQSPRHFSHTVTRTVRAEYLLFLPKGYNDEPNRAWPLMLFLHGAGERGTDLNRVKVHGPPKIVGQKADFPFILVSPQCPDDQIWDNDVLLSLLDEVMAAHRVDTNRVYLTGLSMGGYGTWNLGLTHPDRFAALVPICGGGDTIKVLLASRTNGQALRRLGIWAFHGAKDPVVPLAESQRMVEALKRVGCDEVRLTVYPEAGHDSWTEAYDKGELYEWMLKQRRE